MTTGVQRAKDRPMKLYYAPRTRAARPRWLLEEIGVPYEMTRIDLRGGEHKAPEYLAVHPLGKVPALEDGEITLFESLAICLYLAESFPEVGLAPTGDSPDRAAYFQWMAYSIGTLEPAVIAVYRGRGLSAAKGEAETAEEEFRKVAEVLESRLRGRSFLLGESFTAADVMNGSPAGWAASMGLLDGHREVRRWLAALEDRPAYRRATAD